MPLFNAVFKAAMACSNGGGSGRQVKPSREEVSVKLLLGNSCTFLSVKASKLWKLTHKAVANGADASVDNCGHVLSMM